MPILTIAPMAMPEAISIKSYATIKNASAKGTKLFVQTILNPSAKWIDEENLTYESMDYLYNSVADFDELNYQIAKKIICSQDAVYAVCGRGLSSELMECIRKEAIINNTDIVVLPSSGYCESAAAKSGFNLANVNICTANSLPIDIDVYAPLAIEEIDNVITSGEIKLKLLDFYPEDTEIIFAYADVNGIYKIKRIKLFELDRQTEYFATTVALIRPYSFLELDRYGLNGAHDIMKILRSPNGCPWDIKQTHKSIKSSLIEEAYEVLDAIEQEDDEALCEELGDLLLQIVFHTVIEEEKSCFTIRDVCTGLVKKLIFRHPHVFADMQGINTPDDVLKAWDQIKKVEKKQNTQSDVLKAVPYSFPALIRSSKIQKRAADVGFDFQSVDEAMQKVYEEIEEVKTALYTNNDEMICEEIGDLIFSAVNVARLKKIDPELALKNSADKFLKRFCIMEEMIVNDGKNFDNINIDEMNSYWNKSKKI